MDTKGEEAALGAEVIQEADLASLTMLPGSSQVRPASYFSYSYLLLHLAGDCVASTGDIIWSRTEVRPAGLPPPLFHSSQHQGFPRTQVARAQPPKSFLLAPELRFLQLLESPTPSPHSCFTGTKPRRRKTMRKRNEYNPIPL